MEHQFHSNELSITSEFEFYQCDKTIEIYLQNSFEMLLLNEFFLCFLKYCDIVKALP